MERAPWIVAAVLAVVCGGLLLNNMSLRGQVDALKDEVVAAEKEGAKKARRKKSQSRSVERRQEGFATKLDEAVQALDLGDEELQGAVTDAVAESKQELTELLRQRKAGDVDFGEMQAESKALKAELSARLVEILGEEGAAEALDSIPSPLGNGESARGLRAGKGPGWKIRQANQAAAQASQDAGGEEAPEAEEAGEAAPAEVEEPE